MAIGKCLLNEFGGFKIGDKVRLKIVCVPEDHAGEIISISKTLGAFRVQLKSKLRESCGVWFWIWPNELEKI